MRWAESTGQFKLTIGVPWRWLAAWIARATSSLPVPLSPVMSTVSDVGPTCRIRVRKACITGLEPIIAGELASASPKASAGSGWTSRPCRMA